MRNLFKCNKWRVVIVALFALTITVCAGFSAGAATTGQTVPLSDAQGGRCYYLDAENGDDSGTGLSVQDPWQTLGRLEGVKFQPGDSILLRAGQKFEGSLLKPSGSGTEDMPIVVDMYDGNVIGRAAGENLPVITGTKEPFDTKTKGIDGPIYGVWNSIHLENVSYWTIQNLEITSKAETEADRGFRTGVYVTAENNGEDEYVVRGIHLKNLYIHDVDGLYNHKDDMNGGIYFTTYGYEDETDKDRKIDQSKVVRFDDIIVENCRVENVSRTGISIGASMAHWEQFELRDATGRNFKDGVMETYGHTRIVVRNNYVKDAGGDGIVVQHADEPLVEYNISAGASQGTKNSPYLDRVVNAAIWPWQCRNALFQYNEAYDTSENFDGQAYDCDSGVGTIYQYNYSHDNAGGFMMLCEGAATGSIVRYNISQNDRRSLLSISSPDGDVYNNTLYIGKGLDTGVVSAYIGPSGKNVNIWNNIFFYDKGDGEARSWTGTLHERVLKERYIDLEWEKAKATAEVAAEANKAIQYSHNIYWGFKENELPEDPYGIIADPGLTAAGTAGSNINWSEKVHPLAGYQLRADSPARGAGLFAGGVVDKDIFGNPVGIHVPDIGAHQTELKQGNTELYLYSKVYHVNQIDRWIRVESGEPDVAEFISNLKTREGCIIQMFNSSASQVVSGAVMSGMKVVATKGAESKVYLVSVLQTETSTLGVSVYSDFYQVNQENNTIFVERKAAESEAFLENLRVNGTNGKAQVLYQEKAVVGGPVISGMQVLASNASGDRFYEIAMDPSLESPILFSDVYQIDQLTGTIMVPGDGPPYEEFLAKLRYSAGNEVVVYDKAGVPVTSGIMVSDMKVFAKKGDEERIYTISVDGIQAGLFVYSKVYQIDEQSSKVIVKSGQPDFNKFVLNLSTALGYGFQILTGNDVRVYNGSIETGMKIHVYGEKGFRNYTIVVE